MNKADVFDTSLPAPARSGAPPQEQRDRVRVRLRRGLRTVTTEPLLPQETIGHQRLPADPHPAPSSTADQTATSPGMPARLFLALGLTVMNDYQPL